MFWGLYFSVLLIIEKFFLLKPLQKAPQWVSHAYAMFFVMIGWVIFDFTDTASMFSYLGQLFDFSRGVLTEQAMYPVMSHLPLLGIGVVAGWPMGRKVYDQVSTWEHAWVLEAVVTAVVLLLCIAALVSSTYNPFLYFRF